MKERRVKTMLRTLTAAVMTAALLAGCGGTAPGAAETGGETGGAEAGEETAAGDTAPAGEAEASLPTITILVKGSNSLEGYEQNHVTAAMAAAIGAQVDIVAADADKFNVMMASGDGYDLITTQPSNFEQLIQGGVVQPMDELYEQYGADIKVNTPGTVEFSRKEWSGGTGSLYFLPVQIGLDSVGADTSQGPFTRWDYYKELGCPETENLDEWLQLLADIQAAHPETESGLPVYGVSMFTDWGIWNYKYPMACYLGLNEISGTNINLFSPSTMEYHNMLEENGLYFQSVDYYHKANRLGILDPDAFITNYDDFTAKATNGQLLTGPATWAMGSFNSDHASEAVGFEVIPTSWAQQWGGTDYTMGWTDKCFGINAGTGHADLCMKFINYVYSYDGARTLYSGVEGEDWTMEDGVPTLTEENVKLYLAGTATEEWKKSGLGWNMNCIGLGAYAIDPEDGRTLDLFRDPSMYAASLLPVQKDYSEYYKVDYPDQAMQNAREKYGTTDQSGTDAYTVAIIGAAPDEIVRIEASLTEEAIARASDLVLAPDEEYETRKAEALAAFEEIGLQKVIDYYRSAWADARKEAEQFR